MRMQRHSTGQIVELETRDPLGSGGEAHIYAIRADDSLAAKIYRRPSAEQTLKLAAMVARPPTIRSHPDAAIRTGSEERDTPAFALAWPIDLICSEGERGDIVGFLMPRLTSVARIFDIYNPRTRRQSHPLCDYRFLHRAGHNLAAALGAAHQCDYVVGDVNESNILVSAAALVSLVDTDSFQVRDPRTGRLFRCPVGKPEFTPPELQGMAFRETDRAPQHDLFGLGVVLFQLLMEGTHPFAGLYLGSGDPPPTEERIRSGHYPYGSLRTLYRPSPTAPPIETLDPILRQLFARCFEEGFRDAAARPNTRDWQDALHDAEASLTTCPRNAQHRYGEHLARCPWCERAALLGGRDPFPSPEAVRDGEHLAVPAGPRSHLTHRLSPGLIQHLTPAPPPGRQRLRCPPIRGRLRPWRARPWRSSLPRSD